MLFQYQQVSRILGNGGQRNGGSTPMELGMDGDENDVEITMEKLEAEAKEVRQQLSHGGANNLTRATLNSSPQGTLPSNPATAQRQTNKFRHD